MSPTEQLFLSPLLTFKSKQKQYQHSLIKEEICICNDNDYELQLVCAKNILCISPLLFTTKWKFIISNHLQVRDDHKNIMDMVTDGSGIFKASNIMDRVESSKL